MSKKKDGGKAAKLPKRVGRVKLPKDLRKAGSALIAKANSPAGREAIAVGLSIAAAVARSAAERGRKDVGGAPHETAQGGTRDEGADKAAAAGPEMASGADKSATAGGGEAAADPHAIGLALGHLAQDFIGRLLAPKPKA